VLVNSRDWQDVYQGVLYAQSFGGATVEECRFLLSSDHAVHQFLNASKPVLYIEGNQNYYPDYAGVLSDAGFTQVDELALSGLPLAMELAERADCSKFIIVGDAAGYHAVSAAPYASFTRSCVLFANAGNAGEIASFLSGRAESTMVFGPVDSAVAGALAPLSPETVSTGSRYGDNIEIVSRYRALNPVAQVSFSNGEFLEASLFSAFPVVLIGRDYPPQSVLDYFNGEGSGVTVGVVVGNDLLGAAKIIKDETPVEAVFVKYAQGWAKPGSFYSEVSGLDLFYLPVYDTGLEVSRAGYNLESREIQVTFVNPSESLPVYFESATTLYADGVAVATVSDADVLQLDAGKTLVVAYPVADDSTIVTAVRAGSAFSAEVFARYGGDASEMTDELKETYPVEFGESADSSLLSLGAVSYDSSAFKLYVDLTNEGGVPAFANVLVTAKVNNVENAFETIEPVEVPVSTEPYRVSFDLRLTEDAARTLWGSPALVSVDYGASQGLLLKHLEEERGVQGTAGLNPLLVAGAFLLAIILAAAYWFGAKKRK